MDEDNSSVSDHPGTHTPIEADDFYSDDSQSLLDTQSLRDSIFEFVVENGRMYNKYGDYFLPTDQPEKDRLNFQYWIIKHLMREKAYHAPIQNPHRILDIGTGTGLWCIDMHKEFPRAEIIGTEITPTMLPEADKQPPSQRKKVKFIYEDADASATWGDEKYDFIHTRIMMGSFRDFKSIIQRMYDNTAPGGWCESQELWPRLGCDDDTLDKNTHAFSEWITLQDQAAMKLQRPLRIANKLKNWYEKAGFVDVKQEIYRIPINGWPKEPKYKMLGKFWAKSLLDGLQAFTLKFFTMAHNWSRAECEVYLVRVRQSIADKRVHAYHEIYVVYGRKPTLEEQMAKMNIDAQQHGSNGNLPSASAGGRSQGSSSAQTSHAESSQSQSSRHYSSRHYPPRARQPGDTATPRQQPGPRYPAAGSGRSSENSNRRPRQPFSGNPHGNRNQLQEEQELVTLDYHGRPI